MADFMDDEAMESENELSGDEEISAKKKKKRALDSSDDEEDEEDEEKAREEMEDFIVDNEDEDEEEETESRARKRRKKKRRKRSSSRSGSGSGSASRSRSRSRSKSRSKSRSRQRSGDEDLDDEDMDLIEENLGVKLQKKRSRIQKMDSDDSGEDDTRREAASGSEDDLPDPERPRRDQSGSGRESDEDEDGIQDFIVDEDGQPIKQKKSRKKHIFDDSQRQLAEDIFGVAFDYEEFEQFEGSGGESSEEDYDEEDEEAEQKRLERKKRRKPAKTIFDIFDPFDLEQGHYTDLDQEIRTTDIPERMKLRQVPVTTVPEDSDELDREAEWIYKYGFAKQTITSQIDYTYDEVKAWQDRPSTTEKIKKALDFMRQQFLEVPFIAFYRKEYVHPELEDINALWRVYHMDEKWCQLQNRKKNIKRLMEKMQTYQSDFVLTDTSSTLPEGSTLIAQEDFDRLDAVESIEDLKDVYQHFLLYHGRNLGACQEYHRKKQKEERAERKQRKKLGRQKKYKTVKRKIKRKATKTITKTVTEDVENEETGETEQVEKEVEEEVETEVESEVEEEVTDDEAMLLDAEEEDEEDDDDDQDEDDVIKYARRNDAYALCVKFGLAGMCKNFGLTPEEFGENLQDNYAKNEVAEESRDLDEVVADYINAKLENKDAVSKAAVFMVATQLAKEPTIRSTVREQFYDKAVISLKPTQKGIKDIGEEHELYQMKYLMNKPVRRFRDDEILKVLNARDSKLIEMEIGENLSGSTENATYLAEAVDLYREDVFSKRATEWNELRKQAVELAFNKMLFPELRKELLHKMRQEAIEGIKRTCQSTLRNWIKWAPYKVPWDEEYDEDDWDASGGHRILGVSYSSDKSEASFAALISAEGELADYIRLPFLLVSNKTWHERDRMGKEQDMRTLTNFIRNKRPHGVAVCTEDRNATMVMQDISQLLHDLTSEDEQFPPVKCVMVDSNLAKVYAGTNKANIDFRDHPPVLKQAISVGRRLQDPLVEFSQLCNPENDILCLRFHQAQDVVNSETLLHALYQEFINVVNKVGVDINECVAHPHTNNLVQFIGGLGPRKGASLLKTLRGMSNPRLENRQQLVTSCHMGPKVFINCAGFVKIDTTALGDSEQYIEVLDGSRIHNEAYEWARKMAVDALEYDDDEEEGNPASAVEDILRQPEKLDELNLDAFAEELERQGFGNKQITLYDIRSELHDMYGDCRDKFVEPDSEDVFDMTNKVTPETFYIGKLMQATVTRFVYKKPPHEELDSAAPVKNAETDCWQCPFCGRNDFPELTEVWNHFDAVEECPGKCMGVNVRLDNGIPAFIPLQEVSDNSVISPEQRMKKDQTIYVRITKIEPEKEKVKCTSRTSALMDPDELFKQKKDEYYDAISEKLDADKLRTDKKKHGATYIKRVIVHPSFHNIGYKEAEKLLETMDQGDVIIRPSSKGKDNLSVSWKVTDKIYQHIDVREEGKENAFSLGSSLWIGSEEFEDLDEIIARHINPMASHTRDVLAYKYYKDFGPEEMKKAEAYLFKEKQANATKIPYIFHPSYQLKGKFMLSYLPKDKVRHEYVSITPDGYRFRKQNHDLFLLMVKWFKENFRLPIPGTPTTPGGGRAMGSAINRTPYGGGGRSTPGQRPGITPGAMSMAGGGTPYGGGGTPGRHNAAPYTPTANTPFMTPVNTPGPSTTPRSYGSGTPKTGFPGSNTPRNYGSTTPRGGGATPRGLAGSQTPSSVSASPSTYRGRGSNAGNAWAAAAESWGASGKSSGGGYSTTPRYDDPRLTPKYGAGGRTPTQSSAGKPRPSGSSRMPPPAAGSRTPSGSRTPVLGSGGRTPGGSSSSRTPTQQHQRTPRTPRGHFGDSTPLYDE